MSQDLVVVGVDGSETAERAALTAHRLASALRARLHVVTAFDSDRTEVFGSGSETWIDSDADAAERMARAVALNLPAMPEESEITFAAARGKPGVALVEEAERLQASLIVVGNKRMHGIGRVLGSVANSVAHNAKCDVYIANTAHGQPVD